MTEHIIRPKYWAEQIEQLLPVLQPDDELHVPLPTHKIAIDHMLSVWGQPTGLKVKVLDCVNTCLRCGTSVRGPFCLTCDGELHAQNCPKCWSGASGRETLLSLQDLLTRLPDIMTDRLGKLQGIDPEGPCNCGGDELEHSIRHATHNVQLP